jgi:sugar O-acyltransferase (sialic acid O-acetyltransferase NeuD family)
MSNPNAEELKQCPLAATPLSQRLCKTMRLYTPSPEQIQRASHGSVHGLQVDNGVSTLAILGGGGHGKVVADAAQASGRWEKIVFFDDAWPKRTMNGQWPVAGDLHTLFELPQDSCEVVVAIGDNQLRTQIAEHLCEEGFRLATVVHPASCVSKHARLGPGTVVFAGAVVNIGAIVGQACIINTRATVDHDCMLGTAVHVSPGANLAGEVVVGDCSWVGIGACIRQQIAIGRNVMVGAGAVVVTPFPDDVTVVGVPARIMKRRIGC